MEILKDLRIPQARKVIEGMIAKVDLNFSDVMITGDNTLVIIVRETVIYTTYLKDIEPGFTISFSYKDIIGLNEDEYIQDNHILKMMSSTYSYYFMIESNPANLLCYENNLRDNPEFENLLSLKAKDGMQFFKMNGNYIGEVYYLPVFSGFPSMNKADKINIYVYNIGDGLHFLNIMKIFKKKINRDIKIYYRTIDLGRSL